MERSVVRSWEPASSRCPICNDGAVHAAGLERHLLQQHPRDVFSFPASGRAFVDVQAAIFESVKCYVRTGDREQARFSYPVSELMWH
jgi:hypothetical protein